MRRAHHESLDRSQDRPRREAAVTITRFIETETYGGKEHILPQATPEALRRLAWLRTHFADGRSLTAP
jgi:hypothetical protein